MGVQIPGVISDSPSDWYAYVGLSDLYVGLPQAAAHAVGSAAFDELHTAMALSSAYVACEGLRRAWLRALDTRAPPLKHVGTLARHVGHRRNWIERQVRRIDPVGTEGRMAPKQVLQHIIALRALHCRSRYPAPSWQDVSQELGIPLAPIRRAIGAATDGRLATAIVPGERAHVLREIEERLRRGLLL